MTKQKVTSKRLERKRTQKIFNQIINLFLFAILIFCTTALILNRPALSLKTMSLSGNQKLTESEVLSEIKQISSQKILHILNKNTVFSFNRRRLKENLKENHTYLKNVSATYKNLHHLNIQVTEREAEILWCSQTIDNPFQETCLLVDEEGSAFGYSAYYSDQILPKIYSEKPLPEESLLPYRVITQTDLESILDWQNTLSLNKIENYNVYQKENNNYAFVIEKLSDYKINRPHLIYNLDDIHTKENRQKTLNKTINLLNENPLRDLLINNSQNLQYINLSYGNNIYYKFKEVE